MRLPSLLSNMAVIARRSLLARGFPNHGVAGARVLSAGSCKITVLIYEAHVQLPRPRLMR